MVREGILRNELLRSSKRLDELGLNRGTSGNCSIREAGQKKFFLITPSAVPVDELCAEDMVEMGLDGGMDGLSGKPSSEWRIHRDIYSARSDVLAVVHTHSPFATALSCMRKDLPAFHYMIAVAGGDSIRCAPYSLFGTEDLSRGVLIALDSRRACLLANHGMVAVGATLTSAISLAVEVEALCEQYMLALSAGGPVLLSKHEMSDVFEQFVGYRNSREN